MGERRVLGVVAVVVVAACGGGVQLGTPEDGGSRGSGDGDTAASLFGGQPRDVAVDCYVPPDNDSVDCAFCTQDNKWHCSRGVVIDQCAPGIIDAGTCTTREGSSCLACTNEGTGFLYSCVNSEWGTTPATTPCSLP